MDLDKQAFKTLTPEIIKEAIGRIDENVERYLQLNKMASLGGMLGNITHTFNNILGGILGYSQLLGEELKDHPDALRHAAVIEKAAKRASRLVYQLQILANKRPFTEQLVDVFKAIDEVGAILESTLNKSITLETCYNCDKIYIKADYISICHALLNVCINAKQAMPEGGTLTIETRAVEHELPDSEGTLSRQAAIQITVSDTGCGIDARDLPFVFEPFFSTREIHQGAGMGLTVARDIIERHRGRIALKSEVGEGTEVAIVLPAQKTGFSDSEARAQESLADFNGELVLVVEDETDLAAMAKRILEKKGCRVLLAATGEEAMSLIKEKGKDIALVIIDMVLPGCDGRAVYDAVKEFDKGKRVILTSGYNTAFNYDEIIGPHGDIFIRKPWDLPALLSAARRLLDADRS